MVENQFEARRAILVGDVGDIRHQRNAAVLRNNSLNPNVAIGASFTDKTVTLMVCEFVNSPSVAVIVNISLPL